MAQHRTLWQRLKGHYPVLDESRIQADAETLPFSGDTVTGDLLKDYPGLAMIDEADRRIVCKERFNDIIDLNRYFREVNAKLPLGGTIEIHGEVSSTRKERIMGNGKPFPRLRYLWCYFTTRVIPKQRLTRSLYHRWGKCTDRNYPRAEVMGRMCKGGFYVLSESMADGEFRLEGVKTGDPIIKRDRYGLFVKLGRIGWRGENINVYKLRTMYAYSEYLQPYISNTHGRGEDGKYKDDFRVSSWGKHFRRGFIDELPMFINFCRCEVKLVGVRPVSKHSFHTDYSLQQQQMRISVKPGIFPPMYYDRPKPEGMPAIAACEMRYIEAYKKHPFRTDFKYFWRILYNITIGKLHSA